MIQDPEISPAYRLADAFAAYVNVWLAENNADAHAKKRISELARRLSLAVSDGHVCLPLPEDARALLLASRLVGTPEQPENRPMVLDGENRLYLHRYFDYERTFAKHLLAFNETLATDIASAQNSLDIFFGKPENTEIPDWQRIAAALSMQQRLTVISGGPGTGKTTTVANILGCLQMQNPNTHIVLAAPTGKAAMRMLEAIRERARQFALPYRPNLPEEAFTIHRLLGATARPGIFRHHKDNPLALDVLVVDEASMIDLVLAARLFDALPAHARIILLGDKDQLSAVEAGAVFSELSMNPGLTEDCKKILALMTGTSVLAINPPHIAGQGGTTDSTIWLTRNFRFSASSGISRLALAIRDGRADEAIATLENPPDASISWLSKEKTTRLDSHVKSEIRHGYAAYMTAVKEGLKNLSEQNIKAVFDAFERFRVLCAVREGHHGVQAVNRLISEYLRSELPGHSVRKDWFAGKPVQVLQNDYSLRLFNGDIGIVLPDENDNLIVYFASDTDSFRTISPLRLPEHETAFAMTVHKSQGSEFESLLVLMPVRTSPVITRELFYTAITRAQKNVRLVCSPEVLKAGIEASVQRHTGLMSRLQELDDT